MYKIIPLNTEAYELKDLGNEAKEKAISEHIDYVIEMADTNEHYQKPIQKALDKARETKHTQFLSGIVYDMYKDEMIKDIESLHILFDKEGNVLPIMVTHVSQDDKPTRWALKITDSLEVEVTLEKIESSV